MNTKGNFKDYHRNKLLNHLANSVGIMTHKIVITLLQTNHETSGVLRLAHYGFKPHPFHGLRARK